jgi:hydrogenase nickel incorporation protein HypB
MCETCGCTVTQPGAEDAATVEVMSRLLDANDRTAAHNRDHFDSHKVVAFNLMSSPGAGKTALLEATIDALKSEFRMAVIEGDLETDNDARRIRAHGVPCVYRIFDSAWTRRTDGISSRPDD